MRIAPTPSVPISRRHHQLTIVALILGLVLASLAAVPPSHADDHDAGIWVVNQVKVPLGERLALHGMVQNRWSDEVESYERTLFRPWLSYSWKDKGHIAVGYDLHEFEQPDRWEQRAWQRFAVQHPLGHFKLLGHLWLEERFFQNTNDVAVRARFSAGAAVDIDSETSFVVRNEIMFDLNGTSRIRNAGLGENQIVATLSRKLPGNLVFEIGYLQQYLDRRGNRDLFNHFVTTGFRWRAPQIADWL